jgi:hypothetical protein
MRELLWFIGALVQAFGMSAAILKNEIFALPILFTLWFICICSYLLEVYNETYKNTRV